MYLYTVGLLSPHTRASSDTFLLPSVPRLRNDSSENHESIQKSREKMSKTEEKSVEIYKVKCENFH